MYFATFLCILYYYPSYKILITVRIQLIFSLVENKNSHLHLEKYCFLGTVLSAVPTLTPWILTFQTHAVIVPILQIS